MSQLFGIKTKSNEDHFRTLLQKLLTGKDEASCRTSMVAEMRNMASGDAGRTLPTQLRLDCNKLYVANMEYELRQQALCCLDDMLNEPQSLKTHVTLLPEEMEETLKGPPPTYFEWAEAEKAGIIGDLGKTTEACAIMDKIESNTVPPLLLPQILDNEWSLQRRPRVERMLRNCKNLKALYGMAQACLSRGDFALAEECLEIAKALPMGNVDIVTLQVEQSYIQLERGNTEAAQNILKAVDLRKLKQTKMPPELQHRLLAAMALANMQEKVDEVLHLQTVLSNR